MYKLTHFRVQKNLEDKETKYKKRDNCGVNKVISNCCGGQWFRDSCGDCVLPEHHKSSLKNKCRKEIRYQPFTSSSVRKSSPSHIGSHILSTDHMYLSPIKNHRVNSKQQSNSQSVNVNSSSNSRFIVKLKEIKGFFKLTDDQVIQDFLRADRCKRIADKYLIAMVFAYFKRASFSLKDYTRVNFFICLYLANDVEEDEEEIKYEIFPWVLGDKWRDKYVEFIRKRDLFLRKIDYKAIISRKCCDEIMAIEPENKLWKRERPLHHGGAFRTYMRDREEDALPRGPTANTRPCPNCDVSDSQYDSASPASTSWYISSRDSSPCDTSQNSLTSDSHSSLNVSELRGSLPEDNIWPMTKEE